MVPRATQQRTQAILRFCLSQILLLPMPFSSAFLSLPSRCLLFPSAKAGLPRSALSTWRSLPAGCPQRAAWSRTISSMTSSNTDIMERAQKQLADVFGHSSFRSGQHEVVRLLLDPPESLPPRAVAVFPTGAGKSLTYQLPALVYERGITLVVSPLLALMRDQTTSLVKKGVAAASLDSTLDAAQTRELFEDVKDSKIRLLFVAPERFKNERFLRLLRRMEVALFVVDEAHCISEWGHSFRPDYLRLARYADELNCARRLALTATATPQVVSDIASALSIPNPSNVVRTPSVRPNLSTHVTLVESDYAGVQKSISDSISRRVDILVGRIKSRPPGATIVYVTYQATATIVAEKLRLAGILETKSYHAGMQSEERKDVQDWFMDSGDAETCVVVATIAFGMGIDKANIRYVYHANLPKSLEGYVQEIGRAGRDGEPSVCEVLACIDDLPTLEAFAVGGTPSRDHIAKFVHSFLGNAEKGSYIDVSVYDSTMEFDIRDIAINQMLAQLDLEGGYVKETTPFYSALKCYQKDKKSYMDYLSGQSTQASRILELASGTGKIHTVDVREVGAALNLEYGTISREMDDLVREGHLAKVVPYKLRNRFEVLRTPESLEEVVNMLYKNAKKLEVREVARLNEVVDFLSTSKCQTNLLRERFGDTGSFADSCGHCAVCFAGGKAAVAFDKAQRERLGRKLDRMRWGLVQAQDQLPRDDPFLLARFAAGISSPRLRKLKSLPGFASMSDHSFATLLEAAKIECSKC